MQLGDILVAQGLITPADLEEALERQRTEGGRLGENLVSLGKLKPEDLDEILHATPLAPRSLEDTGIALPDLLNLMTKAMYSNSLETPWLIGRWNRAACWRGRINFDGRDC
jgi:hypothetical protein